MRDNTPADTVIASWDAGVIGYFSDRPVVNLDGVVNSFEWEAALHHAPDATRQFLLEREAFTIVNHDELSNDTDNRVSALYGTHDLREIHREEYVYSGTAGGVSGTRTMATFIYRVDFGS